MSFWKVEKLFEVEGGKVDGIAADNHNNLYFTTSQHLYCWKDNQLMWIWTSVSARVFSPTWDEATQSLYFCVGGGAIWAWHRTTGKITPTNVHSIGVVRQVAALHGHLFELRISLLIHRPVLFINDTRTGYSEAIDKTESDSDWMCLATSANRIGVFSKDHIAYYNPPGSRTIPKINDNVRSAVVNNEGDLIFAMDGSVWLSKDDNMQVLFSELKGVKYLSIDLHGNIYAASDFIVWKITKHSIVTISDKPGQWKRLKLFLVGDGGAGKTSTLRWLMKQPFSEIPSRTDGAEITTTELRSWKETSVDIKEHMAHICIQQNIPNEASQHVKIKVKPREPTKANDSKIIRYRSKVFQIPPPSNGNPPDDNLQESLLQTEPLPAVTNELMDSIHQYQDKLLNNELPMTFHIWDFGGQEVYYNTHHFFLTEAAIYLLVMDLTQSTSTLLSRLQFWLNSIRSYSAESPIVIIGTHKEILTEHETNTKLTSIWIEAQKISNAPSNRHVIAISCKEDDLRLDTQKLLLELAERETAKRTISFRWMLFFYTLEQAASKLPSNLTHLSLLEVKTEAAKCGMDETEMLKALKCFHQLGFLMYYADNNLLKQIIFMQPTQLVKVLRAVVTITHTETLESNKNIQFGPRAKQVVLNRAIDDEEIEAIKRDGRLTNSKLNALWGPYSSLTGQLRSLMEQFGLAIPDPNQSEVPEDQRDLIVPCLVQTEMDSLPVLQQWFSHPQTIKLNLKGATQPLGLASRIIVKALHMAQKTEQSVPACLLFKGGCAFSFFGIFIRVITSAGKIKIHVQHPKSNQMLLETEVAKKLIKDLREFLKDIPFTENVTCFKCKKIPCEKSSQTFMCLPCQITTLNSNTNKPTNGPGIGIIKQDGWKSLGLLLDNNLDWRKLGEKLGKSTIELDDIQRRSRDSSPTKILLTEWLGEIDANAMDRLIGALKDIDNAHAVALLQTWANSNQN